MQSLLHFWTFCFCHCCREGSILLFLMLFLLPAVGDMIASLPIISYLVLGFIWRHGLTFKIEAATHEWLWKQSGKASCGLTAAEKMRKRASCWYNCEYIKGMICLFSSFIGVCFPLYIVFFRFLLFVCFRCDIIHVCWGDDFQGWES